MIGLVSRSWALIAAPPPTDPLGPVSQNPDDVRDVACRLVASSRVCAPPSPPSSVVNRAPNVSSAGGDVLGGLLWVLLIGVVVAATIVAVRYFSDRRPSTTDHDDDTDGPDDDALAGTVVIDRSREPRGWREEAERHRDAGRFRDSLRCRYRALVGDLARRGLLDEIPGRTSGEERFELRVTSPDALPSFAAAADLFDGAWYGALPVGLADDDRFIELDRQTIAHAATLARRVPQSYADHVPGAGDGAGNGLGGR